MQDHVANDGVGKSVAEVTPFSPRVLALINAVVGCGKNPLVVLRIDDNGVNWNVGQTASPIAPNLATVCRSEDVASSKGRATCPYNLLRSSKDNNITNKFAEFTAPGKSFLCMDLSQRSREQNRSHQCNSPPVDKDLLPCLSGLGPEFHRAYPLLLFP
jgi:hypothetical protein